MENMQVRIVVVDDHPFIIHSLKNVLSNRSDFLVVGTCNHGEELITKVDRLKPDVVLMDIRMPRLDGVETTRKLFDMGHRIKVICITGYEDENNLYDMLRAGAKGFIMKSSEVTEVPRAIDTVIRGGEYYCSGSMSLMFKRLLKGASSPPNGLWFEGYSQVEMKIILLICKQRTSKEISEALFLSEKTINYYRKRLMEKMDVKSSIGIAVFAIKNKMVNIDELP